MTQDAAFAKFLPLTEVTEATFYILASLGKPLHGYGVICEVERLQEMVAIGKQALTASEGK